MFCAVFKSYYNELNFDNPLLKYLVSIFDFSVMEISKFTSNKFNHIVINEISDDLKCSGRKSIDEVGKLKSVENSLLVF